MMAETRRGRRILPALLAAGLLSGAISTLLPGRAAADDSGAGFQVVNATVNAGANYVVYFNGKFSNFDPGIIGSTFPLTHAHVDNAPFSEATASPADTGPAGGLVVSNYNTTPPPAPAPQTIGQPQYVDSRYPPGDKQPLTFGSPPGPYATAIASNDNAAASSAGVDTTSTQPAASSQTAAQRAQFDTAMKQWRAQYMSPTAQAQHPQESSAATQPDGSDGDAGAATVRFDPSAGTVVASGDARVHEASFGGGALLLHDVHAAVSITNSGTPQATVVTTVGDASVGGVPVSIGKDGVVVSTQVVPLDEVQAASAALNGVLNGEGISVAALAPQVATSDNEESVTATAVSVSVDVPGPPEQTVIYHLGNVFADDLAVPAAPAPPPPLDTGASLLGTSTLTPPITTGETGGTTSAVVTTPITPPAGLPPSSSSTGVKPPPKLPLRPAVAVAAGKPTWLLVAYLLWQTLIIATLASLWWWRASLRRLPGAGGRS